MLIYGAVLGCLDPVLSIAAGLSCRSPFLSSGDPEKRTAIDASKRRVAALGGGRSDHTLLAVAVSEWEAARDRGGGGGGGRRGGGQAAYCRENGLSSERMKELGDVRQQLAQALAGIGFVPDARGAFDPSSTVNAQARSWRVVKAAVCAGLYPRVVRVQRPMERFVDLVGLGAVAARHTAKEFQFFTRRAGGGACGPGLDDRVFVHPSSINSATNDWSCPYLVYHERVHTSRVFVRDCTEVSPYALLLFGGQVAVQAGLGKITVDGWVRFEAIGRIAALVNKLKQQLDAMLWEKIGDPRLDVAGSKLSRALVKLLQTDGMG
ncbi:unnamed protein product [Discosporangium mesarthrocarpum]